MIHVFIQHHAYRSYVVSPGCIVTGKVFYHEKLYSNEELSQLVSTWQTEEQFIEAIKELNGFYALIVNKDKQLFAAVDRVRSIPLFYGRKGNDFYLSDSAEWVRRQVDNHELDPMAREEFLLTGYVTGPDTLFPDVKQLQAGEAIIVKEDNQELSVEPIRYYRYVHAYEQEKSMDQLMEEHDRVLVRVFNRLIQVANGRTIVVPLSGGYDSRLIVLMLERLKYDNVITFSYGRPGNQESKVSRQVAKSLGFRWEFVPYSNEDWYRWFNSEERKIYWSFASGLSSLGHIQDWPAVYKLKEENVIPNDSVFVPGHTGDFISGGHIPLQFIKQKHLGRKAFVNSVKGKHYVLQEKHKDNIFHKSIDEKIYKVCESQRLESSKSMASAFEKWEWQERQAKFIINSIRVYEFWGYDWWLPLWDYEYMQFWRRVPLKSRINQNMYKVYVDRLFFNSTNRYIIKDSHANKIKKCFKSVLGLYFRSHLITICKRMSEYSSHPLASWGRYSKNKIDFLRMNIKAKYRNVNTASCQIYLKELMNR